MITHFSKYLVGAIILAATGSQAMDVFKISYEDNFSKQRSLVLKKLLTIQYQIPEILIDHEFINDCSDENLTQAMVHLCIDHKGELIAINVDQEFFLNTMKTFSQGDLR